MLKLINFLIVRMVIYKIRLNEKKALVSQYIFLFCLEITKIDMV